MKKVLARSSGFAVVSLVPLVLVNVVGPPGAPSVLGGVLLSVVFSIPFAVGTALSRLQRPRPKRTVLRELAIGAAAGAVMWLGLWSFWTAVPGSFRLAAASWAFLGHLAVALVAGVVSGYRLRRVASAS